jgi:HTH-type transcriptional regulator/antitoxin MqsA
MTTKTELGDCAVCGGFTELVTVPDWDVSATSTKPAVTVHDVECYQCRDCGEQYLEPEQIRAFERKKLDAQRTAKNLLTADEIRRIREQLGVSKERLEKILNLNPRSFHRWESGLSIQSDAVDTVLRLLRKYPDAIYQLADERGIPVNVQRGRPSKKAVS